MKKAAKARSLTGRLCAALDYLELRWRHEESSESGEPKASKTAIRSARLSLPVRRFDAGFSCQANARLAQK